MTGQRAYRPYVPLQRPGGKPLGKPPYRVLIHKLHVGAWDQWVIGSGTPSAQQTWDHLAFTPNKVPDINSSTMLRGKNFRGQDGWSPRLHYRVGKAARVDYEHHGSYTGGADGDAHAITRIVFVGPSSSGT